MKKKLVAAISTIAMMLALIPTVALATTDPDLPNAEVVDLGEIIVTEYSIYDGSGLVTGSDPMKLQIALEFIAKDNKEEAEQNKYGDYTTDFYITLTGFEGDITLDENCYLAGNYGTFGWIQVPLDGMTITGGKTYPVITSVGFDFKYTDICDYVKDFKCGIHLSDEVLEANPGISVSLDLGLSETFEEAKTAEKFISVQEPFVYDVDDLLGNVAQVGKDKYTSLQDAIDAADGKTVKLLNDVDTDDTFTIENGKNVVLDLNGYTITGTPDEAKAYCVIKNMGTLKITGGGKVVCDHKQTGSTSYAVNTILNEGNLTVVNGTIENVSTANNQIGYAIDNNSTNRSAVLAIKDGEIKASGSNYYDGVRQFCNSTEHDNSITVEGGAVSSIWLQNPSDGDDRNTKDVKGTLAISSGEVGSVYLEPSAAFGASIIGGTIGKVAYFESSYGRDLKGIISGGEFKNKPGDALVAEGYEIIESDGVFGVEKAQPDEPADDPTDDPVDEPTDGSVDDPADDPTDDPVDDPTDDPTEGPADEPADDPTGDPAETPEDTAATGDHMNLMALAVLAGLMIVIMAAAIGSNSLVRRNR